MAERPDGPFPEPRQRWRIVFARDAGGSDEAGTTSSRTTLESAIAASGLPVAFGRGGGSGARPRVVLAAPLPIGMVGEHELADTFLIERLPRTEVREALLATLPADHHLVDVFDVWLGAPTLTARLAAADYRVALTGIGTPELERACASILEASTLERSRTKGEGRVIQYDLRPLVIDLAIDPEPRDGSSATTLRMRLRMTPDGATGKPDEVVRAIAEVTPSGLTAGPTVRERLLTLDDALPTDRVG